MGKKSCSSPCSGEEGILSPPQRHKAEAVGNGSRKQLQSQTVYVVTETNHSESIDRLQMTKTRAG